MAEITPVQWLQTAVHRCLQLLTLESDAGEQKMLSAEALKASYYEFSQEEKKQIHQLLRQQFEANDAVLVLSYLIKILQLEEFQVDAAEWICKTDYDATVQTMLEIQLDNIPYETRRIIHRKNVQRLAETIKLEFPYRPVQERNTGRIVIITEQLIIQNLNHAPTRMTLETARILQKYFGFEVEIFTCASNKKLPAFIWINAIFYNSGGQDVRRMSYKDSTIPVYEYPLSDCGMEQYREMLSHIYEFNPFVVLEMGVLSPIADLPHLFTTTVNLNMVTEAPVSDADIFIRHVKLKDETEAIYRENLLSYQKQFFMEQKFPAIFDTEKRAYTRAELHLPEDRFLIAVVGNCLDTEIDDSFEQIMAEILQQEEKADFVIIGETLKLRQRLSGAIFKNRVYYLGYCPELAGTLKALNLYLNPERAGGGWSSAIALYAGLAVVTLPEGDVAYNVSKVFVVQNRNEIVKTICRYASDSGFYEKQKEEALRYAKEHGETKVIDFCDNMLNGIKENLEQ